MHCPRPGEKIFDRPSRSQPSRQKSSKRNDTRTPVTRTTPPSSSTVSTSTPSAARPFTRFRKRVQQLEEANDAHIPLKLRKLEQPLPRYECVICTCLLDVGNVVIFKCGHMFHDDCATLWYLNSIDVNCPTCRVNRGQMDMLSLAGQMEQRPSDWTQYPNFETLRDTVVATLHSQFPLEKLAKDGPTAIKSSADCYVYMKKHLKDRRIYEAYYQLKKCLHFLDSVEEPLQHRLVFDDRILQFDGIMRRCNKVCEEIERAISGHFDDKVVVPIEVQMELQKVIKRCMDCIDNADE